MELLSIQLDTDKLVALLEQGVLSGADIQCNDAATKALIQEVCLKTCIKKICRDCSMQEACASQQNGVVDVTTISLSPPFQKISSTPLDD